MRLTFSPKLYPLTALQKAAEAFKELAAIEVRAGTRCITVTLTGVAPEVKDTIAEEFGNYALSEVRR